MPPVIDPARNFVVRLLLLLLLALLALAPVSFTPATINPSAITSTAITSTVESTPVAALPDLASAYRRSTEHKRRAGPREEAERAGRNGWAGTAGNEREHGETGGICERLNREEKRLKKNRNRFRFLAQR